MLRISIEKPFYPHGLNGKVFNFKKILSTKTNYDYKEHLLIAQCFNLLCNNITITLIASNTHPRYFQKAEGSRSFVSRLSLSSTLDLDVSSME